MSYFKNDESEMRHYGWGIGRSNTRMWSIKDLFPEYTSNKPSKKRYKVKQARKQKLKNQKK